MNEKFPENTIELQQLHKVGTHVWRLVLPEVIEMSAEEFSNRVASIISDLRLDAHTVPCPDEGAADRIATGEQPVISALEQQHNDTVIITSIDIADIVGVFLKAQNKRDRFRDFMRDTFNITLDGEVVDTIESSEEKQELTPAASAELAVIEKMPFGQARLLGVIDRMITALEYFESEFESISHDATRSRAVKYFDRHVIPRRYAWVLKMFGNGPEAQEVCLILDNIASLKNQRQKDKYHFPWYEPHSLRTFRRNTIHFLKKPLGKPVSYREWDDSPYTLVTKAKELKSALEKLKSSLVGHEPSEEKIAEGVVVG